MARSRWSDLLDHTVVALALCVLLLAPAAFGATLAPPSLQLSIWGGITLAMLAIWAIRAQGAASWQKTRTFLASGPNLAILAFTLWTFATIGFSISPERSVATSLQLGFGVLIYFLLVYQLRHSGQVRTMIGGVLAIAILFVLGAFVTDAERRWRDLSGTFLDRQLFGAFLCVMLPMLIGVASGSSDRRYKIAAQLAALLVGAGLLLTQCRSAWIGAAAGLSLFLALGFRYAWTWKQVTARKHELLITPVLAVVVLGLFVGYSRMDGTLKARAATLTNASADPSVVDRIGTLWKIGGQVFAARPVVGWGAGTYAFAQHPYNPESRSLEAIGLTGPSLGENPHNTYLLLGSELGAIGLLLYLSIIGLALWTALRALPRTRKGLRQGVVIGAIAALAAHAVDAVGNPGWSFPQVSLFLWVILGLAMNGAGLGEHLAPNESRQPSGAVGVPLRLMQGMRTAGIVAAGLALGAQLMNISLINPALAGNNAYYSGNQCPLSQGYWKTHTSQWKVTSLSLLPHNYSQSQLLALLNASSSGDASVILAKQLIAAKLNIANGSLTTPVSGVISSADAKLGSYGRIACKIKTSSPEGTLMTSWGSTLDKYNNNQLTPGCAN